MTTPLPTDEELERWAKFVRRIREEGDGASPDEQAHAANVERLLAYVRHLRGEVARESERAQTWERRFNAERADWQTAVDVANMHERQRDEARAEVSDLRKQLAARDWKNCPGCGDEWRPAGEAILSSPADEEARLSDPKRHPYRQRLDTGITSCADCGRSWQEHHGE